MASEGHTLEMAIWRMSRQEAGTDRWSWVENDNFLSWLPTFLWHLKSPNDPTVVITLTLRSVALQSHGTNKI